MSEPALSKRARKKQAREGQAQGTGQSDLVASDPAKKDDLSATPTLPELDSEFKMREGTSPFIDVIQKKVRNMTKRKTRLEALDAQSKDESLPPLKSDQIEALSHLPSVIAVINELNELIPMFKKLEQSENDLLASQYRKYKDDQRESERARDVAVREAYAKGVGDGRGETKILTSFLRYASHLRGTASNVDGENHAVEQVLFGVYQGGDKAPAVAQKLVEGVPERIGEGINFTYADIKEAAIRFEDPARGEPEEPSPEQLNGSYDHLGNPANHNVDENGGYQVPMGETPALDNGAQAKESDNENITASGAVNMTGMNFFQHSEQENDIYPTAPHGFSAEGISFLQESELGTNQAHVDYTKGEGIEKPEDLSGSPPLPPIQTLTEDEGPPKVNLGVSTFVGAGTEESGNIASEETLSKPLSSQQEVKVVPKSDWAEEVSPTTESTPVPLEKKKEEEWTTQSSRHSRHQSQQRGRGTGQRGGRDTWRGGEGRGNSRGGYRTGRGGERGASNGERRGSWRNSERGRGRGGGGAGGNGGSGNLPATASV